MRVAVETLYCETMSASRGFRPPPSPYIDGLTEFTVKFKKLNSGWYTVPGKQFTVYGEDSPSLEIIPLKGNEKSLAKKAITYNYLAKCGSARQEIGFLFKAGEGSQKELNKIITEVLHPKKKTSAPEIEQINNRSAAIAAYDTTVTLRREAAKELKEVRAQLSQSKTHCTHNTSKSVIHFADSASSAGSRDGLKLHLKNSDTVRDLSVTKIAAAAEAEYIKKREAELVSDIKRMGGINP